MIGEMPSSRTKVQVLKVRGGSAMEVVPIVREPLGVHVHWLGVRSFMCPGRECPACFAAVGSRWAGFLPVRWKVQQSAAVHVGILELTGGTFERVQGLLRMVGLRDMLGVKTRASRGRDRGPLRLEPLIESVDDVDEVKEFPGWMLRDAIATLYGLPSCPEGLSGGDWEAIAIPHAVKLIRVALPRALA